MAATNFTPIILYHTTTASAAPTAGNLNNGELAININDGKLFYKDSGGTVQVIATKAGANGDVVGPGSATDNALARFDATTGKLIQNSVGILNDSGALSGLTDISASGSVTLSAGAANGLAYLNASKVLTTGSVMTFNGVSLLLGAASATERLRVESADNYQIGFKHQSAVQPGAIGVDASSNFLFYNNGGEVMRFDSSGNLILASPGTFTYSSGAANGVAYLNGSKVLTTGSGFQYAAASNYLALTDGVFTGLVGKGNQIVSGSAASDFAIQSSLGGFAIGTGASNVLRYRITDTGDSIWYPPGGSEGMRLTSTGLGIGTSSPSRKLDVNGAIRLADANRLEWATGQYYIVGDTGGAMLFGAASAERARITSAGNLAVGSTTASARIHSTVADGTYPLAVSGTTKGIRFETNANESRILGVDNTLNGSYQPLMLGGSVLILASSGNTERARIDSSGNLLVGTTSGSERLRVSATNNAAGFINTTSNATTAFCWNQATSGDNLFAEFATEAAFTSRGSIDYNRAGGLTRYNTTSDYRAKDIIGPVQNSGAAIDALKVYEGKMKGATQSRPMLVAHEAQAVTPYAVTGEKDAVNEDGTPKYQQMDVSSLVPLLLAEIQSLRARVAALESN